MVAKLAGQVAAAGVLVWSGAQISWLPVPGGGTLILTQDQATALTILVVVATINAVNFIDGLDGLAAGVVGIAATAFFVYYYTLARVVGLPEQAGPALAGAVLAGACLGFVPHNFYPARIFMGDTGSMLLGLLLAYAPISSIASLDYASLTEYRFATVNRFPEILPLIPPLAILVIPYADLLLAVIRRTRAGLSPFAAGPQAPAPPAAGHRPLAPAQRADHVPVDDAVLRHRGLAVGGGDAGLDPGRGDADRDARAAADVHAAVPVLEPGPAAGPGRPRRSGPPPARGQPVAAAAGSVTAEARPAPRARLRPGQRPEGDLPGPALCSFVTVRRT